MTRDDIIRMAREAGFRAGHIELYGSDPMPFVAPCSATDCMPELVRFAAIVAAAQRNDLRAKIEEMEKQEPVAWMSSRNGFICKDNKNTDYNMPLYLAPSAQPAPDDGYVGWYCAHCQRGVDASEVTYHEQHEACGRVITDDRTPKPAPSIPEGWLRAIDEALVVTHIGVANESDTYEQAKAKLVSLIGFHVDVASDPAVNGGWKLVPSVPEAVMEDIAGLVREVERNTCTHEETHRSGFIWEICDMCGAAWADDRGGKPEFKWPEVVEKARAVLATTPEAKP